MPRISTDLPYSNPWVSYATYPVADEPRGEVLNLSEHSARAIDEFVAAGVLTPEEVYEAESNSENPRKGVLNKYAPESPVKE